MKIQPVGHKVDACFSTEPQNPPTIASLGESTFPSHGTSRHRLFTPLRPSMRDTPSARNPALFCPGSTTAISRLES